jgi:DNA-binding transcriptional regulator LsrR (DeoR family)
MEARTTSTRPDRRAAAAYAAARLHFADGLSQAEIAERLSVSRSTVSRLLAQARESGIVRIELRPPVPESAVAQELAAALALRRVVLAPSDAAASRHALVGPALAELAALNLKPGDVLVLGWGRTLWELSGAALPALTGVHVTPAIGGLDEVERAFQSNEIVRRAGERSGAIAHLLHAPAMPNAALRRALLREPSVAGLTALWDRIDAAIVGVGAPAGRPGSYSPSHVGDDPRRAALADAAGDVATRYFDLTGRPVAYPGEERLLGVTRRQLQHAGTVIAAAAGEGKAPPIVGAARAGLVDVLITDAATATAALELAQATA